MARPQQSQVLEVFKPIDGLTETTQLGGMNLQLKNVLLRPAGGIRGPMKYDRLWAIGSTQSLYATVTALDHPTVARKLNDSDRTVALRVNRQGKNLLFFYNLPSRQCRGLFYLGDDGTYTSGSYDFLSGSGLGWEVLATDLDDTARWYGQRIFKCIYLGNGVDDNVVAQLGRTAAPGRWRKAASNVAPGAPVISVTPPATTDNVQAFVNITRTSGKTLTFRAKDTLFPGLAGNGKIKVTISNNFGGDPISSVLSGQGTVADPYSYTLTAGTTSLNSSTDAIVSYVNADSRVTAILSAAKSAADADIDLASYGPDTLTDGSGSGTSAGFSNRTVTFYARYWDPGQENFGYEGVSSDISNEIVIPTTANNDIRVFVPVDPTAESGRFPFIRLFQQYNEAPNAVWLLINPDDPVPNGLTSTFTRYGGSNMILMNSPSGWSVNDVVHLTTTGVLPGGLALATNYCLQTPPVVTGTFTRLGTTSAVVLSGTSWVTNARVRLTTSGLLPGGLTTSTDYYLRPRSTTPQAWTRYLSTNEIVPTAGDWAENDPVAVDSTGALPSGLSAGVTYYLRPGTATGRWYLSSAPWGSSLSLGIDGTGSYSMTLVLTYGQWLLSLTSGGSGVALTDSGSGTQTATLQPVVGQWQLSPTPDGSAVVLTDSGSGTQTATLKQKCVQVGTQTPFLPSAAGGEMFQDQSRPLPHTLHAFASSQVWRGGCTDFPERLYVSKPNTADEVAPEGVSLDDQAFVPVFNQGQRGGTNKMTALVSSQNRLDVHYDTGITMLDPTNTDAVNYTATGAGAINSTTLTVMEGNGAFFLGGDLQLRKQDVQQTGAGFAATVASNQFAALAAVKHLRARVDLAELARKPQRAFLFPDTISQHLWMSLPGLDGNLKLFGFDLINSGIVGELDFPRIYAACQLEPNRPEILFADEDGNLFVYDPTTQQDTGDTLGTQAAWTAYSPSDPIPVQYAGYGYVDSGGVRYYQAAQSVVETGMLNLMNPSWQKSLAGVLFRTVQGSRAVVTLTVTGLDGVSHSLTLTAEQTYSYVEHRLNAFLGRTSAVKLKFEILGAEQKGWIIRDVVALWLQSGRV